MERNHLNERFSFKIYKQLSTKEFAIALELRYNRQKLLLTMPFRANENEWNEISQRFYTSDELKLFKINGLSASNIKINKNAVVNNQYIDKKEIEVRDIVNDFNRRKISFTNAMIKERLITVLESETVESFIDAQITKLTVSKRFSTVGTYNDLLNRLRKFDKSFKKRHFAEIDYKYVEKFVAFVQDENINNKRKRGGVGVLLRTLRLILSNAIDENVGSRETYPFSNRYGTMAGKKVYKIAKETNAVTKKRYIPKQLLKKFYEFKFDSLAHQRTQKLFFFSFFCSGMNFKDMAILKKSDIIKDYDTTGNEIEFFKYYRAKTKTPITIQLNDNIKKHIEEILNSEFHNKNSEYLLPIITNEDLDDEGMYEHIKYKRKYLNKYLKAMAEIMDFPKNLHDITIYFARHSYAMFLYNKTGSIDIVSAGLNHSNTEITKVYIESFGSDKISKLSDNLLD